ncbi:NAD dependent epimerase/dehydratase family protein [Sinomicrobium oceani]|uniref:NAD dependent epimerase/dehydratase family protein n=1 Tax=Sinomicrobium oceani TaxID=1150368 RepID=A0A1K1QST7_9FLAO|nr:NAD-dependent epimerase/dehydratase family protein [Sinomicrobium oceani]SFW62837.1 NAD dependent epimerase/dehydratase family protein [Sinomicrobium oceani]
MTETILVTGANGFLGNHIVRMLGHRKYQVMALVRPGSDITALRGLDCTILYGQLHNVNDIENAVQKSDYVIHCASYTNPNSTNTDMYLKVNVDSTKLLVKACEDHRIRRFVLVSTANCFTNGSRANPGNEDSGFMPWLRHSGYAYSKYLAQQYVLEKHRKEKFPAVVVAPTFLVGPNDTKPSSGALLLYAMKNKILFCPGGGKSFVDVRAAASATVNVLTLGDEGSCYLLSGANMDYKTYFRKVETFTGQRKYLIPLPKILGTIFRLLSGIIPAKRLRLLNAHLRMLALDNYFSNEKAKKILQMSDTNIDEALKDGVHWFTVHGYDKNKT